jgi:hypothetical protein
MAPSILPQGKREHRSAQGHRQVGYHSLHDRLCPARARRGHDQLTPSLRFDRSLSRAADPSPLISRTPERLPFIQSEGAFDYVVDANHRAFERRAAGMSFDSRERLSPFSPPQRELVAFWSRIDSAWKTQVFLMKEVAEGNPQHWGAGAFAVYPF